MLECLRHSAICASFRISHSCVDGFSRQTYINEELKELAMGTIWPRSPIGFRWRIGSSSRYGTITCVPALAVSAGW